MTRYKEWERARRAGDLEADIRRRQCPFCRQVFRSREGMINHVKYGTTAPYWGKLYNPVMERIGVVLLAIMIGLLMAPASAQTRYDHDGSWVYDTIRQERSAERRRERRQARREARFYRGDHYSEPRRYHWVEHSRRYYARDREESYGTRVYGVVMRKHQFVQRHSTSHIECFQPIQQISQERSSEALAMNDAELGWQNQVSARYGQLWSDYRYAANKQKQCFRASFDESIVGRNREALAQNLGTGDGFKSRCIITANPCQAPVEISPESRSEIRAK